MKQCPQCKQTYSDDNLNFCLSDGTALASLSSSSLAETVVYPLPLVRQAGQSSKRISPLFAYSLIAILALIVGGGVIFLLRPKNPVLSVSPANIGNSSSPPIPVSEETIDIEGVWTGTFSGKPATIVFKKAEGKNRYGGILSRTRFDIAIDVYLFPNAKQVSFEEKHVTKGEGWGTLGTSSGSISVDGKSMTGGGRDESGKSYAWSFSRP